MPPKKSLKTKKKIKKLRTTKYLVFGRGNWSDQNHWSDGSKIEIKKSLKAWAVVWKKDPDIFRADFVDGRIKIYETKRDAVSTLGSITTVRRVKIVFDD